MKQLLTLAIIVVVSPLPYGHISIQQSNQNSNEQDLTAQERKVDEELKAVGLSYKAKRFVEAQKHSERALELDPANRTAPFFIARSVHYQYKPGLATPKNIALARKAISAYQKILVNDPENEEAYQAIAFLFGDIKEDKQQREWIMRRAANDSAPKDKRAEAYTVLASKEWRCSYITEQPENNQAVRRAKKEVVRDTKPKHHDNFQTSKQCVTRGLELIEAAISLDPDYQMAWLYKQYLSLEMAKLSELMGQRVQQSKYEKKAYEARLRATMLKEKSQKKPPASWVKVAPTSLGFSVNLPGAPKEESEEFTVGSTKTPSRMYTLKVDDVEYFVGRVGDFSEELIRGGYLDVFLDRAHQIFFELKPEDGKPSSLLTNQRNIFLDGNAGREYEAVCGPHKRVAFDSCVSTLRVYKVGGSLYIIGLVGPKAILSAEHINKFFGSFTITR